MTPPGDLARERETRCSTSIVKTPRVRPMKLSLSGEHMSSSEELQSNLGPSRTLKYKSFKKEAGPFLAKNYLADSTW